MNVRAAPRTTQAAEGLPRRRLTIAEVEALVAAGRMEEDERVELVGGELVPMSPKGSRHEIMKIALLRRWYRAAPDDVEVAPEKTIRFSEDTYLEPDVVLYDRPRGLTSLSGESVLLVVEIVDSLIRYDTGRKAARYASFGERELWVRDAVRLEVRVLRRPGLNGYGEVREMSVADAIAPAFAPMAFTPRLSDLEING